MVYVGVASPASLKPWADEDNTETRRVRDALPIPELLQHFSFGESWVAAAALAAETLGVAAATQALVLFDGSSPHTAGDQLGNARCIGRFRFDVGAPRVGQVDRARSEVAAAGLEPDIAEALDQGLVQVSQRELVEWHGARATPVAADIYASLDGDARQELDRRMSVNQRKQVAGLQALTTTTHRAWFFLGHLIALTPCDELSADIPADTPRPIESCRPEGRPGVYIHRKEHRIIQSTEVDDWRAWMDDIRGEWTQQSGWRYVAVVFPTREEALALKAEKLRKPYVRGWYTHSTGVYEP